MRVKPGRFDPANHSIYEDRTTYHSVNLSKDGKAFKKKCAAFALWHNSTRIREGNSMPDSCGTIGLLPQVSDELGRLKVLASVRDNIGKQSSFVRQCFAKGPRRSSEKCTFHA